MSKGHIFAPQERVNEIEKTLTEEVNEKINELNKTLTEEISVKIDELDTRVEQCFQSVSDGKVLVASAITDKGVTTASDATFETMAENIGKVVTGKLIYLGTGRSFDVKTVCTNNGIDYTKLTNSNFIVGGIRINWILV